MWVEPLEKPKTCQNTTLAFKIILFLKNLNYIEVEKIIAKIIMALLTTVSNHSAHSICADDEANVVKALRMTGKFGQL
jgi:hypothetical protein